MSADTAKAVRTLFISGATIDGICTALNLSESVVKKYLTQEREPDTAFSGLIENLEQCAKASLDCYNDDLKRHGEKPLDLTPQSKVVAGVPGYTKEQLGDDIARAIGEYIMTANSRGRGGF